MTKTKAIYGIRVTYNGVTTSGNVVLPTLRKAKALAKKRASEFPDWLLEVIERPLCYNGEYLSEDDGNIVASFGGQKLSIH